MNWQEIIFGDEELAFLAEIALRSLIMFFLIFGGLRVMGKRGVKQLSVFELLIIIALGSAAGDPMIYKEVGVVYAVVVFTVVFFFYWLITKFIIHSEKMEKVLEGEPVCIIREGKASEESLGHKELAMDEFFSVLRNHHILHLGQVENAVLETSGEVSLLLYDDNEIKPGLPVWPDHLKKKTKHVLENGLYACTYCGNTQEIISEERIKCSYCNKNEEWVKAENDHPEK